MISGCYKCGGTIHQGADQYGAYFSCYQCGALYDPLVKPDPAIPARWLPMDTSTRCRECDKKTKARGLCAGCYSRVYRAGWARTEAAT